MARRDQYIKSKANYTLKKLHTYTDDGTIYEQDQFTIFPVEDTSNGDVVVFSDSNFKFRVNTVNNESKKHFKGNWVKPDNGDDEFWTEQSLSDSSITEETKIEIKSNYNSIKDFAYYGSAKALIEASVKDILLKYPAGIYYLGADAKTVQAGQTTYYVVANDFDIDICSMGVEKETLEYPMRVLSATYDKYIYGEDDKSIVSIECQPTNNVCTNEIIATTTIIWGDGGGGQRFKLYTYLMDTGEKLTLVDTNQPKGTPIIRPRPEVFSQMYRTLDDFEKILLNIKTRPLFKAVFMTPYFDGQNYYEQKEDYIWPSITKEVNGEVKYFTPDLKSVNFSGYISKLMSTAEFHDEYDSDNLWRMMTHDSIKNLDWTHMNNKGEEYEESEDFDSSRIYGAIQLYGRQYDDIKRYADNIKSTNAITYDEKNNVPDYFLTDFVEKDGWDAYSVAPTNDNTVTTNRLFTGEFSGKNSTDANINFMRVLSLNSSYLKSLKGTKRGLTTLLDLFGFESGNTGPGTYSIKEYVGLAKVPSEFGQILSYDSALTIASMQDTYGFEDDGIEYWPIAGVVPASGNSYIVPWFEQEKKYDADIYFQMKGGWENMQRKLISLEITTFSAITSEYFNLYGETLQYMRFYSTIDEMLNISNNDAEDNLVCYVEDISDIFDKYVFDPQDTVSGNDFSHYFVLKNKALSPYLGYVDIDLYRCYGWRNVLVHEYDGTTNKPTADGTRVLYCESIETTFKGNNPHAGYGDYDDGEDYLSYFRQIFKHGIEANEFSMVDEDEGHINMKQIRNFGFCIDEMEDNKKCHYFIDIESNSNLQPEGEEDTSLHDDDDVFYDNLNNCENVSDKHDESNALMVMNLKKILINFNTANNNYLREYIENVVIKYIEQMMPSTAIFGYTFDNEKYPMQAYGYTMPNNGTLRRLEVHGIGWGSASGDTEPNFMAEYDLTTGRVLIETKEK